MASKRKKPKQTGDAATDRKNAAALAVEALNAQVHSSVAAALASAQSAQALSAQVNSSVTAVLDSVQSTVAPATTQKSRTSPSRSASPWYGGSWRSKASAVAQVARESISVAGGATSESSNHPSPKSPYMHTGLKRSSKSVPLAAEATRVNAKGNSTTIDDNLATDPKASESNEAPPPAAEHVATTPDRGAQNPGSWFGWWSRPDGYAPSDAETLAPTKKQTPVIPDDTAKPSATIPIAHDSRQLSVKADNENALRSGSVDSKITITSSRMEKPPQLTLPRSWFGLWSASQNLVDSHDDQPHTDQIARATDFETTSGIADAADKTETADTSARRATVTAVDTSRPPTGWAFWSSDKPKDPNQTSNGTQKHLGELAVADTPSQSHPEAAQFNEQSPVEAKQISKKDRAVTDNSRLSTASLTNLIDASASAPSSDQKKPKMSDAAMLAAATKTLKSKIKGPPNHIMPSFHTTYPLAYTPSYLERFGQYLASSLRFDATSAATTPNHVCIAPTFPKVKNAIAIGVHGYFPAPIIQKVLGQPTGTSIRFANYAADAIRWWSEKNQPEVTCEIEQTALEGEGLIADRVNTLWKLLLNWLSHLRKADLILLACHSQGVPVSIMLLAKLIELGCLSPNVRIGICAMAGVNLGPFLDFKSKFFGGSAAELFEFADPPSRVSREYAASLDTILRYGVRVTYVGSLDDQLVSLESSLFANLSHPYVQRAVFVDGRHLSPDFVAHLVAFALKLRNLGISDHGLIRELSSPLAGSLYGGEGHSRVYDDDAVYQLAVDFTLNTTDIDTKTYVSPSGATTTQSQSASKTSAEERGTGHASIPSSTTVANKIRQGNLLASQRPGLAPHIAPFEAPASAANANPYYLPWAMRGILEEPRVRETMRDEVDRLIKLFDDWKPVSKPLRDVKFRLEAVKSKA